MSESQTMHDENAPDIDIRAITEEKRIREREKALLDNIRGDAEFIIDACDGECYCDPAAIADGHGPCAPCQCFVAANGILSTLSNAGL